MKTKTKPQMNDFLNLRCCALDCISGTLKLPKSKDNQIGRGGKCPIRIKKRSWKISYYLDNHQILKCGGSIAMLENLSKATDWIKKNGANTFLQVLYLFYTHSKDLSLSDKELWEMMDLWLESKIQVNHILFN